MINDPVDKYFGVPMSEWIKKIPNELEVDAVSLGQIVEFGRDGYSFSGDDLIGFVSNAIMALLKKGAKPVRASNSGYWIAQSYYGSSFSSIVQSIVQEWLSCEVGEESGYLWDIWFSVNFKCSKGDE